MSRARYDGRIEGASATPQAPGNFDKGELRGYFAHLFTRDFDEVMRLRLEVDYLTSEVASARLERDDALESRDFWREAAKQNAEKCIVGANENRRLRRELERLASDR